MDPVIVTFVILIIAIFAFVWDKFPVGIVAIAVALALYFTGVITFEQSLAGFGDPVIIFIAALFVVSEGLDASGVMAWAGQKLITKAGPNRKTLTVLVLLLVAVLTALISVNGAVAALVPMVVVLSMRLKQPPSRMLLPLAFGAHAGSLLVMTGSPVNVLISELAEKATGHPIGFFSFGLAGVPLVIGTILITVLFGSRLIPDRKPAAATKDLSSHAATLALQYSGIDLENMLTSDIGLTEVLVPPRSPIIGERVFPGMVTDSGELVIVAIQRFGEDVGEVELAVGDVLLLRGTWEALSEQTEEDPNVLVIDPTDAVRRQAAPLGAPAKRALIVVIGMVILLGTGLVPPAVAALLAAGAMLILRVITVPQAHRSISWTTLLLVGGMIPLSTAITSSGAAELIANGLVDFLGKSSPYILLLGVVVVTVILGQLISNMATALIIAPIAIAIAAETGMSPLPLLMGIAVAGAAAFLTPVATPANTMVMGPGGYRFGDYWKLGLPLLILFVVVATLVVPIFWPF